jgi:hypothetical protein
MRRITSVFIVLTLLLTAFTLVNLTVSNVSGIVVTQDITSPTTWSGSVSVMNSITVKNTLTISAGTTIYMEPGTTLYVDATITAKGNNANEILFTSNATAPQTPGDWYGIVINSTASCTFDYVVIDYAEYGLYFNQYSGKTLEGVLKINRAEKQGISLYDTDDMVIGNVTVTSGKAIETDYGIYTYKAENNEIKYCDFTFIDQAGIRLFEGSNNNSIHDNTFSGLLGPAVRIDEKNFGASPSYNNVISENQILGGTGGIYLIQVTQANLVKSNVIRNIGSTANGVFLDNCDNQVVEENSFEKVWRAISVYDRFSNTGSNEVNYNFITDSFFGIQLANGVIFNVVDNNTLIECHRAISVEQSGPSTPLNSTISSNLMVFVDYGITVNNSQNFMVSNNSIAGCKYGIVSGGSATMCNYINNYIWKYENIYDTASDAGFGNTWDYNYYNDYTGADSDGDDIGDTSTYLINFPISDSNPRCIITTSDNPTRKYARIDTPMGTVDAGTTIYVPWGFYLPFSVSQEVSVEGMPYDRTGDVLDSMMFYAPSWSVVSCTNDWDFAVRNATFIDCWNAVWGDNGRSSSMTLENIVIENYRNKGVYASQFRVFTNNVQIDNTGVSPMASDGMVVCESYEGDHTLPRAYAGNNALYSGVTSVDRWVNRTYIVPNSGGPYELTFWQWHMFQPGKSCGVVEFFNDSGLGTWDVLPVKGTNQNYMNYPTNGTRLGFRPGFTGSTVGSFVEPTWEKVTIDMNPFKPLPSVNIRWRYHHSIESDIQMPGWLIDDAILWDGGAGSPLASDFFESGWGGFSTNGDWFVKDLSAEASIINDTMIVNASSSGSAGIRIYAAAVYVTNCSLNNNFWNLQMARDTGVAKTLGCLYVHNCYMWGPDDTAGCVQVDGACYFEANESDFYDGSDNIVLMGVYNTEIIDCYIENAGENNLELDNVFHAELYFNRFANAKNGIYGDATEQEIGDNTFEGHGDQSIYLQYRDKLGQRALWNNDDEMDDKMLWYSDKGEFQHNTLTTQKIDIPDVAAGIPLFLNLTHLVGAYEEKDACQVFAIAGTDDILLKSKTYDSWAYAAGEFDDPLAFTRNSSLTWRYDKFNITPWAGQQIKFKFVYKSAEMGCDSLGWYLGGLDFEPGGYTQLFMGNDGGYVPKGWKTVKIMDPILYIHDNAISNNTASMSNGIMINTVNETMSDDLYSSNKIDGNVITNVDWTAIGNNFWSSHSNCLLTADDNVIDDAWNGISSGGAGKAANFFTGNDIRNINKGIQAYFGEGDAYAVNTTIAEATSSAIVFDSNEDMQFFLVNNTIYNVSGVSPVINVYSPGNITDSAIYYTHIMNTFQTNPTIYVYSGGPMEEFNIRYNVIHETSGDPLNIDCDSFIDNLTIADNNFTDNSGNVWIEAVEDVDLNFTNNEIVNNTGSGLHLTGQFIDFLSSDNYLFDNDNYGLLVSGSEIRADMSGDTAVLNDWAGVVLTCQDLLNVTIIGLTSTNNGGDGLYLRSLTDLVDFEVWISNMSDNGDDGCEIEYGSETRQRAFVRGGLLQFERQRQHRHGHPGFLVGIYLEQYLPEEWEIWYRRLQHGILSSHKLHHTEEHSKFGVYGNQFLRISYEHHFREGPDIGEQQFRIGCELVPVRQRYQ